MAANTGKFLRINLSTGKTSEGSVSEQVAKDFVGGRGYGIKHLYDELKPGVNPLGADNKLILLAGPLAGTGAVALSRWMAITKSPLTGGYARSVGGADFGAWLRFLGYEFLIIEGKAKKRSYLHITPEGCTIEDASPIWGKDTKVTQDWLIEKHGRNTRNVCIGPAGENLVKYAAIVSDRRTAGRCGTGAVMGSKNLKAVSITAARKLHLFDEKTYGDLSKEQVKLVQASRAFENHKEWGTMRTQNITNAIGVYPTQNFRYGRQTGYERIIGEEYRTIRTGDFGCYACPARCGKQHVVKTGPYAGACSEGPEYESTWAFTGTTDCVSLEATIAADQLCDDLGLDTISAGGCIGWAFELYERGIITQKDTDGLALTWGNHKAMVEMIKKIAHRDGIGDLLAEGVARASAKVGKGSEVYAIHVKGLELPAYEPRGAKTQGYNYATSNIGASHCFGYSPQDIFGAIEPRPSNRFAEAENADLVKFNQDGTASHEVGIVCAFANGWGWANLFPKLLAAARGIEDYNEPGYLTTVGERIINLERAFNVREGFGRKDDTLPPRLRTEPLHTRGAPGEGQVVRHQDDFLDNYYALRGWSKQGVPTARKMKELGLEPVEKAAKK